jgi:hypothetical protein
VRRSVVVPGAAALLLLAAGGGLAVERSSDALAVGDSVTVCAPSHTVAVSVDGKASLTTTIAAQCVTTAVPTVTVTQTVSTTPTSSAGGFGIIAWGGTLSNYTAAHQQAAALISVNAGPDATAAAALPGRSTIYMDADLIRQDGGSGVPYAEAGANGYLEPTGDPSYPGTTYAKIDAPGYATWFANKAVALAKQYGVDGIWLDDASASGNPYYTPATQKAAIKAIVQALGAALHANGLYLMASANGYESGVSGSDDGSLFLAWWETLAPYVDGITNEYWQELASDQITMRARGTNWYQHWDDWQAAVSKFHADFPGKDFSGLVYGPSSNHVYGRASLALANPQGIFIGNNGSSDVIQSSWATCPHPAIDPVAATATC